MNFGDVTKETIKQLTKTTKHKLATNSLSVILNITNWRLWSWKIKFII